MKVISKARFLIPKIGKRNSGSGRIAKNSKESWIPIHEAGRQKSRIRKSEIGKPRITVSVTWIYAF